LQLSLNVYFICKVPNFADDPAAPAANEPAEEEEDGEVDDTGLDPDEINTIMSQTSCTRAKAVSALKKKGNIVDAILALTP
jgi:nascent polypeptide-associated complex subunit alpha